MRLNAWILDVGLAHKLALGGRELLHLVDVPATYAVPYTPDYCCQVIVWQGRLLPLMDLACRLGAAPQPARFAAVVGYQEGRGEAASFGAISLLAPPRQIAVSDDQACSLPEALQPASALMVSCFEHEGSAVPVLNMARLFSTPPAQG